jgi:hypothetical protein
MSATSGHLDDTLERLQVLLAALEGVSDAATRNAVRELAQVVLGLHRRGLRELLDIVDEAGGQPADILLPRFLANPAVRSLLLLHDLHPDELPARVNQVLARLRPHVGVHGLRIELSSLDGNIVRLSVSLAGPQSGRRPDESALRQEIESAMWELVPDAAGVVVEGLEVLRARNETLVPVSAIAGLSKARTHAAPVGE